MGVLAWSGPVDAQVADNDVRCLTVAKFFAATEKDPMRKQLAVASAFFYLGRVDARLSEAQLKAQISGPHALIKQAEVGTLMTACAKRVQITQNMLMGLGQAAASPPSKK